MPKALLPAVLLLAVVAPQANAQMVDIPIWSNGILGQQALRNTYDNYNRAHGLKEKPASKSASASAGCSADALPAADRRKMEIEYARRQRADGKASADAWVHEQGRRFHMKLVADGICPPPPGAAVKSAQAAPPKGGKQVLNERGQPCTKTRLEHRVSPGLGGAAMTMGMVPVCAD
jgi:hypothetical protein